LAKVKVKQKGQVTIPAEFRAKLGLREGTILNVKEHPEGLLLQPIPPPESGEVVGEEEYQKMLEELEQTRRCWR
jgi:AbrB family looped-hinge helix DNA binding protein